MAANLLDTWNKLKAIADRADGEVLERIARAYAAGYVRVDSQVQALTEQLEALQKSGKLTATQVKQSAAYKNLIKSMSSELDDYSAYLRTEITASATEAAQMGSDAGYVLMLAAVAMALGVEVKDIPKDTIIKLDDRSLYFLAKYLDPDGVLFEKINMLSSYHAGEIADGILDRVGMGLNPRDIAEWITDAYGYPLTDSLRQMRTVQLYSYRQANNIVQIENAELLDGVVWCAELDDRTCDSCISLHGQIFPVGSECDDHYNGRCAMLPLVKGRDNPITQTGENWFNEQDEDTQRRVMGDSKWEAWNDGKFEFNQLSKEHENDIYGMMRGSVSLKELLGE